MMYLVLPMPIARHPQSSVVAFVPMVIADGG